MVRWKFVNSICLFSSLFLLSIGGLFSGEGDVDDLCPPITLAIEFTDQAHVLPYFLGWLENCDYPKANIYIEFYINSKEDSTHDQIIWWQSSVQNLYGGIKIHTDSENWLEAGLRTARLRKRKRVLFLTGNTLPDNPKLLRNLQKINGIAIIPYLHSIPFRNSPNLELELDRGKTRRIEINEATLPLYLDLEHPDISYLTFDMGNLLQYENSSGLLTVFGESCRRMGVEIIASAESFHGYWLEPQDSLEDHRSMVRSCAFLSYTLSYLVADWVANEGVNSRLPSRSVRPFRVEPTKCGVDQIFVINLERRKDRLSRVENIMEILGIEYTVWKATDGQFLPKDLQVRFLPEYLDPYHQRPMKAGEVGCFLSHFRIWEEIVRRGLKTTIIFEDDIRVVAGGLQILKETLEDLRKMNERWDFIYLGRKKNTFEEEHWIPGHRHLSTIGYSYWTLGYMISLEGAKKLLATKPLEKLLPVDEYLPIMYEKHPNLDWVSHFSDYDPIIAYSVHPLIIVPQRYMNEHGYVSDTESSELIVFPNNTQNTHHNEL